MKEIKTQLKQQVFEELSNQLHKQGHNCIRSFLEQHDDPPKLGWKESAVKYRPDLVSSIGSSTFIYEAVTAESIEIEEIKIFEIYADQQNGELVLLVPESQKSEITNSLKKMDVKASMILICDSLADS